MSSTLRTAVLKLLYSEDKWQISDASETGWRKRMKKFRRVRHFSLLISSKIFSDASETFFIYFLQPVSFKFIFMFLSLQKFFKFFFLKMFLMRQNHFHSFSSICFWRVRNKIKNLSVATDKFSCVDFAYPL